MTHTVYLSLGSNLGNRRQLLHEAITLLDERVGEVTAQSSLVETEPWGFSSPNKFLNACVACTTRLDVTEVLRRTQAIERDMGRTQKSVDGVYHDRIIDIDLLLFDHLNIHTPELTLPHPQMWDREFVTVPLAEIGVTRETVEQWDIEK